MKHSKKKEIIDPVLPPFKERKRKGHHKSHYMRNFLLTLLFVLLLGTGGVTLFAGYLSPLLPKTGVSLVVFNLPRKSERVIVGRPIWAWDARRLIPSNTKIYNGERLDFTVSARFSGSLPLDRLGSFASAAQKSITSYAAYLKFSLVADKKTYSSFISSDGKTLMPLSSVKQQTSKKVQEAVNDFYGKNIATLPPNSTVFSDAAQRTALLKDAVTKALAGFHLTNFQLSEEVVPKYAIYNQELHNAKYIRELSSIRNTAQLATAQNIAQEMTLIAQYGALLDKYPQLLEYFKVAGTSKTGSLSSLLDQWQAVQKQPQAAPLYKNKEKP